jgi:hypothetical protein
MIAPDASNSKGLAQMPRDHGFVNEIIKLPKFSQVAAVLTLMMINGCLRPGS